MTFEPGLVSVIVPAYNAQKFLERCLESVLSQTYDQVELIVVDDGSMDGTEEILNQFYTSDRRIKVLRHPRGENRGVSKSRQLGVESAHGEFVAFLDADDWMMPKKIETQVSILRNHPECVLSHTAVRVEADSVSDQEFFEQGFNRFDRDGATYNFRERRDFLLRNHICNSTVLIRASTLQDRKFSFQQLFQYEDWTLWVLVSTHGRFHFLPIPLTVYRYHESAATQHIRHDSLKGMYSHLEFLLTVASLTNEKVILDKVGPVLNDVLISLLVAYNPEFQRDDSTFPLRMLDESQLGRPYDTLVALKVENERIKESLSWRIGRVITWPIRVILKKR